MHEGIRWQVLTHEHRDRSTDWYWGFGILAVVGIGLCVYFGNMLFALIIALAAISIGVLLARGPREHDVHVHPRGVTLDGTLYPYPALQSFWVHVEDPYELGVPEEYHEEFEPRSHLLLTTTSYIHPTLTIPLDDLDHAQEVRDYLVAYVVEEKQERHFSDHVAEALGL